MTMNNSLRDKYLEELGIPDFLFDAKSSPSRVNKDLINVKCLVIESTKINSFCVEGESNGLLLKMLSAIGLSRDDIECINIEIDDLRETINKYNAVAVLLMGNNMSAFKDNQFITHHPSKIIDRDELKRESWEVLKLVKKCLN